MDPSTVSLIDTEDGLRALHHAPMSRATDKVLPRLDDHCRALISLSPFCVISTQGAEGADTSPRGDPPGFVRVLDDNTLLLPDRVGNNRLDAMVNLLSNPLIGMLFLVPGVNESLRINGTARITDDAALLAESEMQGRAPKVALLITVREAFVHCGKALVRSSLWDPAVQIDRATLPSYPQILMDHCAGLSAEENDTQSRIMEERGLY